MSDPYRMGRARLGPAHPHVEVDVGPGPAPAVCSIVIFDFVFAHEVWPLDVG